MEDKMKLFYVKHKETGEILPVYFENDKGFLFVVPFREAGLGISGPAQYTLKKPYWEMIYDFN